MELYFTALKPITGTGIEKACKALGLELTMKGALKSLPHNEHWHYKKGKLPGVLEITLLLQENCLIFTCKKNRQGDWVTGVVNELKKILTLNEATPKA